ncbi:MAG: hypothetical protein ACREFB_04230 [Stellaceae bacterium]
MKTLWAQLQSWPPLPLTVVGLAILSGLAAFEAAGGSADLTASIPAALGAIGTLKVVLPQQSGPTIDEIEALATRLLAADRAGAPKASTNGGNP